MCKNNIKRMHYIWGECVANKMCVLGKIVSMERDCPENVDGCSSTEQNMKIWRTELEAGKMRTKEI